MERLCANHEVWFSRGNGFIDQCNKKNGKISTIYNLLVSRRENVSASLNPLTESREQANIASNEMYFRHHGFLSRYSAIVPNDYFPHPLDSTMPKVRVEKFVDSFSVTLNRTHGSFVRQFTINHLTPELIDYAQNIIRNVEELPSFVNINSESKQERTNHRQNQQNASPSLQYPKNIFDLISMPEKKILYAYFQSLGDVENSTVSGKIHESEMRWFAEESGHYYETVSLFAGKYFENTIFFSALPSLVRKKECLPGTFFDGFECLHNNHQNVCSGKENGSCVSLIKKNAKTESNFLYCMCESGVVATTHICPTNAPMFDSELGSCITPECKISNHRRRSFLGRRGTVVNSLTRNRNGKIEKVFSKYFLRFECNSVGVRIVSFSNWARDRHKMNGYSNMKKKQETFNSIFESYIRDVTGNVSVITTKLEGTETPLIVRDVSFNTLHWIPILADWMLKFQSIKQVIEANNGYILLQRAFSQNKDMIETARNKHFCMPLRLMVRGFAVLKLNDYSNKKLVEKFTVEYSQFGCIQREKLYFIFPEYCFYTIDCDWKYYQYFWPYSPFVRITYADINSFASHSTVFEHFLHYSSESVVFPQMRNKSFLTYNHEANNIFCNYDTARKYFILKEVFKYLHENHVKVALGVHELAAVSSSKKFFVVNSCNANCSEFAYNENCVKPSYPLQRDDAPYIIADPNLSWSAYFPTVADTTDFENTHKNNDREYRMRPKTNDFLVSKSSEKKARILENNNESNNDNDVDTLCITNAGCTFVFYMSLNMLSQNLKGRTTNIDKLNLYAIRSLPSSSVSLLDDKNSLPKRNNLLNKSPLTTIAYCNAQYAVDIENNLALTVYQTLNGTLKTEKIRCPAGTFQHQFLNKCVSDIRCRNQFTARLHSKLLYASITSIFSAFACDDNGNVLAEIGINEEKKDNSHSNSTKNYSQSDNAELLANEYFTQKTTKARNNLNGESVKFRSRAEYNEMAKHNTNESAAMSEENNEINLPVSFKLLHSLKKEHWFSLPHLPMWIKRGNDDRIDFLPFRFSRPSSSQSNSAGSLFEDESQAAHFFDDYCAEVNPQLYELRRIRCLRKGDHFWNFERGACEHYDSLLSTARYQANLGMMQRNLQTLTEDISNFLFA